MPARVRILCRNESGEILLLKWRDPLDAHVFWEPPGGGIEAGEEPDEAAVRELYEETGYQTSLADASLLVERDYVFAGHHHRHTERFFFTTVAGSPSPAAFSEQEIATFLEARFVHPSKLVALDALVEPPHLGSLIAQLIPAE
ncbi:MAG TPA: NUDIX domain-containing protein [Acidimicrobiales bacterium]